MALPVKAVRRPAVLAGQPNGKLPAALLATIAMPGGGTAVVLAAVASKWSALLAAAARAGHRFAQVGDYRPYADQERIFRDRYTTTRLAGRPSKTWQGRTWWQRPGTAVAATPGTSNHGWGLALDLCMEGGRSITDAAVAWLCAHAAECGISAEIQSEDWHWRPYDGDARTAAVLAYEEDAMTKEQWYANWRQYGMQMMQDPIVIPANPALDIPTNVEEPNMLARALTAIKLTAGPGLSGQTVTVASGTLTFGTAEPQE